MPPTPRPSRLTTLAALLAAACLLGGLAGAGDAVAAVLRGHTSRNPFALVPETVSFGAAIGLLASLPLAYREVLLLVAVEGLQPIEAAAICGVSAETLRQRLRRARVMLTRQLESTPAARAIRVGEALI